ncbi:gluconokinase [Actinotalea sp. K2]|uniref:gluconokinase n=1 Tax=Actinotalea sp. K2 TaxID=2939438 RepID=UPI00201730EA|nr:gluconokinase [Actinotalea sp. K2]MCL3859684.1 gluconokinase [Actinotalea sp. K2]
MGGERDEATTVRHLVVMGVAGSGKTTLATLLAERLGWRYAEADEFHPQANIDKMTAGTPLDDEDRWPWLRAICDWLSEQTREGTSSIVTCSALKTVYRDVLREADGEVLFVHLTAAPEVIGGRMQQRAGHFMPPTLLPSQLQTLQPLEAHERGVTITVDVPPEEVADRTIAALGLHVAEDRET